MKIRTSLITIIVVLMTIGYTSLAFGAVGADEANKLGGPELTPIGAERAGNKDGSIPAWTGVPIPVPKGYVKGSGFYVDPFADEKPLFSISAKNMAQYTDKLAEGLKVMMKKYPDYRIDVYKTHRTLVFPDSFYESSKRCATACKLIKDGLAITGDGCYGGVSFPIPKNGNELLWNHMLKYGAPEASTFDYENYNITSTGKVSISGGALYTTDYIWNRPRSEKDWRYVAYRFDWTLPARRNGEGTIIIYPKDWDGRGSTIWSYLPGQRWVRLAPDMCCDTPNSGTAGASTYDDTGIWNGSPERYNWKIIGKKEMYVPYNAYRFVYYRGDVKKAVLAHFVNPDLVRWELHRVFILEGTLKPGKRHVYSRRIMYVDEDSMSALMADNFDKTGNLYRMALAHETYSYDVRGAYQETVVFYDHISNSYAVNVWPRGRRGVQHMNFHPESYFSPDSMAGEGRR